MKGLLVVSVFLVIVAPLHGSVVDLAPERGRKIPSINWTDESGRARKLSEFSGYPLILLPIYSRCPGPCLQNIDRLKEALADSSNNPRQFRVLLFSFDATDDATRLAKYRQRENITLGWSIGAASQNEIDALLESIGIQVGQTGTEFAHPNILLFLDPKLRVAKWISGTSYSGRDVDLGLKVAAGESDWTAQHAQLLYSLLLFAASSLCVALCYYLMQLISLRRSSGDHSVVHPLTADR